MASHTPTPSGAEGENDFNRAEAADEELSASKAVVTHEFGKHEVSPEVSDSAANEEGVTTNTLSSVQQDAWHMDRLQDVIGASQDLTTQLLSVDVPYTVGAEDAAVAVPHGLPQHASMSGPIPMPTEAFESFDQIHDDVLPTLQPTLPTSHSGDHELGFEYSSSEMLNKEQTGYFKLEFPDAQLYIATLRTVFGRDKDATRRRKMGHVAYEGSQHEEQSVISESGGIVNLGLKETRRSKKSRGRTSRSSSSLRGSRRNSIALPSNHVHHHSGPPKVPSARIFASGTASEVKTDNETTWVKLHAKEGSHGGGISREHAAIIYNFEEAAFELHIYGRNGAFLGDDFYSQGAVVNLQHGCRITISGVSMKWLLPYDGAGGAVGSEAQSAMSFEFEDGRGESIAMNDTTETSSSEADEEEEKEEEEEEVDMSDHMGSADDVLSSQDEADLDVRQTVESDEVEDDEADEEEQDEEVEEQEMVPKAVRRTRQVKLSKSKKPTKSSKKAKRDAKTKKVNALRPKDKPPKVKIRASPPLADTRPETINDPNLSALLKDMEIPLEMLPPRRKGPGRPPKNGYMSKREQAVLIRQRKEQQKAEAIQNGTFKPPKVKVSENEDAIAGKRKYTKRKRADGQPDDAGDLSEAIEDGENGLAAALSISRAPKEKRPPKPPRSPSPVIDASKLTEEQLAKPTQSYVVLIHEALSNSPQGQMSLPQIYRAIERRYPYFKFKVSTQGWQSSVRHNLSQHAAFKKIERDGKGWMWGLVPEVNIEKEKKRRVTPPPPMPSQPYYQPPQQTFRPPPPQYPYHPMPSDGRPPPHHPAYMYPPPPGHGYPPGPFPSGMPQPPAGMPLPPGAPQSNSTYQSPYTPAPSAPTQQQNQDQQRQQISYRPYFPSHSGGSSQHGSPGTGQIPAPSTTGLPYHYQPLQNQITRLPFEQTSAVIDSITKFKEVLMLSLKFPHAEEIVDRVIDQALNKIPTTKQALDPSTADAGIYKAVINLLKPLREKYDHEQAGQVANFAPPASRSWPITAPSPAPADGNTVEVGENATDTPFTASQLVLAPTPDSLIDKGLLATCGVSATHNREQVVLQVTEETKEGLSAKRDECEQRLVPGASNPSATASQDILSPSTPEVTVEVQSEERARISNLLAQLESNPSDDANQEKAGSASLSQMESQQAADEDHGSSKGHNKPASATEVLHVSEEAASLVMSAMGAGTKRRHEDETKDYEEDSGEPAAKRAAVS